MQWPLLCSWLSVSLRTARIGKDLPVEYQPPFCSTVAFLPCCEMAERIFGSMFFAALAGDAWRLTRSDGVEKEGLLCLDHLCNITVRKIAATSSKRPGNGTHAQVLFFPLLRQVVSKRLLFFCLIQTVRKNGLHLRRSHVMCCSGASHWLVLLPR